MSAMKRMAIVFSALALAGCVYHRSGAPEGEYRPEAGVSTRREVVEHWGNPDKIKGETWSWKAVESLGGKVKASYMALGVTVSNINQTGMENRITFDEKGVVRKVEKVENVPGGTSWSIWPF